MHSPLAAVAAVATIAHFCAAAGTMQLPWTTDLDDEFPKGTFGPDGPWQAVAVYVGDDDSNGQKYGVPVAMWPGASAISQIPTVEGSGNYSVNDSSSAYDKKSMQSTYMHDIHYIGSEYFESVFFPEKGDGTPAKTNGSILAVDEYYQELGNDGKLNQSVGILGLGSDDYFPVPSGRNYRSLLEQLEKDGKIGSVSFSMHIGSVEFDQPGSLVLGGYNQNRIMGHVGVFYREYGNPIMPGAPLMSLLDVVIGFQTGDSPDPISVFAGLKDKTLDKNVTDLYNQVDGPEDSVLVTPNPAVPYIYLPPGTCQKLEKQLPISFYGNVGFYLWETSDARYDRIITSPSYLAFVFSDMTGANITVKVPFQLLSLTLEPPMTNTPMPYFPCKDDSEILGIWSLGRAFLQAAFLAVNFEANRTYMAQAPGPGMSESVIKEMTGDESPPVGSEVSFDDSWKEHWTVPPEEDGGDADGRLSAGAIAGIVVGVMMVLAAVVAVVFWRMRARRTTGESDEKIPDSETVGFLVEGGRDAGEPGGGVGGAGCTARSAREAPCPRDGSYFGPR